MTAMKPPTVKAAFGQVPLTATPTWTDLSKRLRRVTIARRIGEAGQVVAVLDNRDRALEAEYSGSVYYPNVKPNVRLRFEYQEDNILDYDTSSAEGGMGTVAAANEGATVTRTTTQALHGSWSFLMTSTGGAQSAVGPHLTTAPASSRLTVAAGDVVSVRASFRAATTGRSCSVGVRGYDSGGSAVWTPANQGAVTDTTTGWVEAVGVFAVPAVPAVVSIIGVAFIANAPNDEQHYVDCLGVERPTIGTNMMSVASASLETGIGAWVGSDADVTVARTTDQAVLGSWSLRMTRNIDSINDWGARHSTRLQVVAGRRYLYRFRSRAAATNRSSYSYARFFNAGGSQIGSTNLVGTDQSNTTGWSRTGGVALAPATATQTDMSPLVSGGGTTTGEIHYIDDAGIHEVTVPAAWTPGWIPVADAYIDSLPPSYIYGANGGDSVVTASCTDITKFLARYPLRSPYELEVEADAPTHWWRLGEAEGQSVIGDRGSAPTPGKYAPSHQLGGAPVTLGTSLTSLQMEKRVAKDVVASKIPPIGDFQQWTVEGVVRGYQSEFDAGLFNIAAPGRGTVLLYGNSRTGATYLIGKVIRFIDDVTDDFVLSVDSPTGRSDLPIHWAFTRSAGDVFSFYVRGQLVGSEVRSFSLPLSQWVADFEDNSEHRGRIGEIAFYTRALTAAEILAHHTAASEPWIGDSTGERVNRILDQVGFPAAWRNVNVGQTSDLGAVIDPLEHKRALDVLRKVDETEMGWSFVTADGVWRFIGRRDLRPAASKATFGDAAGEVPYADLVPDYSEADVIRTATITREGGIPQTHTDPTAGAGDVVFDGSRDGLMYGSDHEALDAATWLVAEHKDPHLSFRRMTLTGERSTDVMRTISRIDLGDKVTVRRRPPGGGAALERTVVVLGVTHDIDCQSRTWHTTYELGAIDVTDYWILEDAVFGQLDSTTVLAF